MLDAFQILANFDFRTSHNIQNCERDFDEEGHVFAKREQND